MLELIAEPLEPALVKRLREWLNKPEAHILKTVIDAKLRLAQEQALVSGMKADGENAYSAKSMMDLRTAQRYQIVLSTIAEITNPETSLETIKLKT